MKEILPGTHLGKPTIYKTVYDPALLQSIPRQLGRDEMGIDKHNKPFIGLDIWNAYELSWLNSKNKPEIALAEFHFPDETEHFIESKALKLYLYSLNQTKFSTQKELQETLHKDLSHAVQGKVNVSILRPQEFTKIQFSEFEGDCLDNLDITIDHFNYEPSLLKTENQEIFETVYTHLFRCNCPITNQPDWANVLIRYQGQKIQHESLLKYLVSFRQKNEFHEQCVERIFVDILNYCCPSKLTVYARFARRGGLDINPFRTNYETLDIKNIRTFRQ